MNALRLVHFVVDSGPSSGECRPAIVVRVQDASNNILRVAPILDDAHDGNAVFGSLRVRSATEDQNKKPGTWHEGEQCPCTR